MATKRAAPEGSSPANKSSKSGKETVCVRLNADGTAEEVHLFLDPNHSEASKLLGGRVSVLWADESELVNVLGRNQSEKGLEVNEHNMMNDEDEPLKGDLLAIRTDHEDLHLEDLEGMFGGDDEDEDEEEGDDEEEGEEVDLT